MEKSKYNKYGFFFTIIKKLSRKNEKGLTSDSSVSISDLNVNIKLVQKTCLSGKVLNYLSLKVNLRSISKATGSLSSENGEF